MKTLTVQKTALTGNYAVAYATKMAKPHVKTGAGVCRHDRHLAYL
jgi:hypothetical protein